VQLVGEEGVIAGSFAWLLDGTSTNEMTMAIARKAPISMFFDMYLA
jgi:hypothetical protein